MSIREQLDSRQYGATVRCRGLSATWLAIEWLTATAGVGPSTDRTMERCTSGWSGLAIRLLGKTKTASFESGGFQFRPTPRVRIVDHLQFASHEMVTSKAHFIVLRFGKRKTRHKLVESSGAQAASVVIESITQGQGRRRKQLVVSYNDDVAEMLEHDPETLEGEGGGASLK
jgi:hypothetical protein